jgi:hypothetical protein
MNTQSATRRTGLPGGSPPPLTRQVPVSDNLEREAAAVVLDLPPPISVNKIRRYNWKCHKRVQNWIRAADALVFMAKCRSRDPLRLLGIRRFEITIVLSEADTNVDLDNTIKLIIDYARRIYLIENDSPKHMRRVIVEWGCAPQGSRVVVRPLS